VKERCDVKGAGKVWDAGHVTHVGHMKGFLNAIALMLILGFADAHAELLGHTNGLVNCFNVLVLSCVCCSKDSHLHTKHILSRHTDI
jgi:hypothetical protein